MLCKTIAKCFSPCKDKVLRAASSIADLVADARCEKVVPGYVTRIRGGCTYRERGCTFIRTIYRSSLATHYLSALAEAAALNHKSSEGE